MANIGDRPSNDQPLSHWDGCYKNMQHHECAVAMVAQLQAALREAMEWDWLTDAELIPTEVRERLEGLTGSATPEPSSMELVVCQNCDGTGKLHGTNECRNCSGTGRYTRETSSKPQIGDPCPTCGSGRIGQSQYNLRCANCGWLGPRIDTTSRPVMNPPADKAEARNRANTAPRQADSAAVGRGMAGPLTEPEARPVTPTAQDLCEDCPPIGYPTDETRCTPCPRRSQAKTKGDQT